MEYIPYSERDTGCIALSTIAVRESVFMPASVQGAQSFSRSIGVLQLIADAEQPLSRAALMQKCALTRPTLYRIIASLEAEGLIEAAGENRYRLGGRLVSLARMALARNDVRSVAAPVLSQLRDATGETAHLAVRSGNELVYIDKIESHQAVRMASSIGTRVAMHSTAVGKAYLGAMPPREADALIDTLDLVPVTKYTRTGRKALKTAVSKARKQGFVLDEQENELGIVCFGAAICEAVGRPIASVSVSIPLFRVGAATRYSDPLLEAVTSISRQLGFGQTNS
jgi:IclR family transcriptional regulator, KDG regulon repressor